MFVDINETIRDSFDAEQIHNDIVEWIKDWFAFNGKDCNAIVGISGGKDSSVVAALCVEALGKDRVIGVLMPNGSQPDINYSYDLVKHLEIKKLEINIQQPVWVIELALTRELYNTNNITEQTRINLPARIRMATLYGVAQSCKGRVANTCNLSEDWIGYSTRYGDSAGDFSPLASLTTDEVIAVGKVAGLPEKFLIKPPSDGLCGKTDEDNLGFSYTTLNTYLRTGICPDEEAKIKIDAMHSKNLFKLYPMPSFIY